MTLEAGERLVVKVNQKDIVYFSSLLSTYEGVGIVRTIDSAIAIVEVLTTKDMMPDLKELVESLKNEIYIEEVESMKKTSTCNK